MRAINQCLEDCAWKEEWQLNVGIMKEIETKIPAAGKIHQSKWSSFPESEASDTVGSGSEVWRLGEILE